MLKDNYTRYPRAILWLVRGGTLHDAADGVVAGVSAGADVAPFYMGKTPITNCQYEAFKPEYQRSPLSPGDNDSAVQISYEQAVNYCAWYARVSRKPMRLPTELEWEYACRGGTGSRYFFGDDPAGGEAYMWDAGNSGGRIRDPHEKKPNPFGLLGMLGGVHEWTTAAQGTAAVLRGGSCLVEREATGCAIRRPGVAVTSLADVGFRIVRSFRSGSDSSTP